MEVLAFTYLSVNYEDPSVAELREFDVNVSKAFPATVAGSAIALSMAVSMPAAQAAVRMGDSCQAVYTVQNELAFNGFLPESGKDSNFGPQTKAAVMSFQRAHGLTADGIVGAKTAEKLGIDNPSCGDSTGDAPTTGPKVVTPSGRALNIRETPNGRIVGSLANGASVTLTSERQSAGGLVWAKLSGGNWVAVKYIQ